jgi:hypothetical protein
LRNSALKFFIVLYSIFSLLWVWEFLPEKWRIDSIGLLDIVNNKNFSELEINSFDSVAFIYKIILTKYIGWHWIVLLLNFILIIFLCNSYILNKKNLLILILIIPYTFIYTGILSKELILIFFILLIFSTNYNMNLIIIIIYSIFFRQYWFITLILYYANYSIFYKYKKIKINLLTNFLIIIAIMYFYHSFKMEYISSLRDYLTLFRLGDDTAESLILNINLLNPGLVNDLVNYLYIFTIVVIPFFFLSFTASHIVYFFYWCLIIFILLKYFYATRNYKNIIFIVSYFLTLIFFEPDFGSFSRHFSIICLPILIAYYK